MELNDVFKANNYAGRKKVLDRFPLSKKDKDNVNKSIEKLNNSNGGGNDGAFNYKSRKVVWSIIDKEKFFNNNNNPYIPEHICFIFPIYSVVVKDTDNGAVNKYYGYMASANIYNHLRANTAYEKILAFEEAEGFLKINLPDMIISTNNGLIGMIMAFAEAEGESVSEEEIITMLKDNFGLEKLSYEEYANAVFDFDYKFANF